MFRAELAATPYFVGLVSMRRDDDDWEDEEDDEDEELDGESRAYIHLGCGGGTVVSGGDYSHICNPFWMCTGTFCCGCQGYVGLSEVVWSDTGEPISEYRARMRSMTPTIIKIWAYGAGFIPGVGIGGLAGLVLGFAPRQDLGAAVLGALVGAGVGGFLVYLIGLIFIQLIFGINYRTIR